MLMLPSGTPGTVPSHAPHTINQVIIFSYFKGVLDIIEAMMTTDGVMTCRFDGDLKHNDRARELEDFKKNPKKKVLLCTIGSGGVGLNIVWGFAIRWCARVASSGKGVLAKQLPDKTITTIHILPDPDMSGRNELEVYNR